MDWARRSPISSENQIGLVQRCLLPFLPERQALLWVAVEEAPVQD